MLLVKDLTVQNFSICSTLRYFLVWCMMLQTNYAINRAADAVDYLAFSQIKAISTGC